MRLTRRQAFAVAAIIALIVAGLVYFVLTQQTAPPEPEEAQEQQVLTAATEIAAYETVTAEMVSTTTMKVSAVPSGALTDPSQAIGKISKRRLSKGHVFTQNDVSARSASQGLTFVIPEGMRAVTVALDPISGVGGFVYPGDHVDVLTTFQQGEVAMTRTILQNVEVLAMNEQVTRPAPSGGGAQVTDQGEQQSAGEAEEDAPAIEQVRSATVSVSPDEAQTLLLSALQGAVHLALRPREDDSIASLAGTTNWQVMGMQPPQEQEAEAEPADEQQGPYDLPPGAMWAPGWAGPANGQQQAPAAGAQAPEPEAESVETVEIIRGGQREVVSVP